MSSVLPEGWEYRPIGDLGEVVTGFTPSTSDPKLWDGEIPFVSPADFTDDVYVKSTTKKVSELGASKGRTLPKNAIMVTCIGSLGEIALTSKTCITNQQINSIVVNELHDPHFMFYNMKLNSFELKRLSGTTTIPIINKTTFSSIELPVPPLPEQQKIAEVLGAVDDVIEKTSAQIKKLQDLKKATMNELLTKGIGHTQFKQSELGTIPESWEVAELQQISSFITSGSRGWAEYYSNSGALFIRIGNLTRNHINMNFNDVVRVNPPKGGEGTRTRVKEGDVLISITADLGIIGVVPFGFEEAYVNQHVALVRLSDNETINPRWVGHFLSSFAGYRQFIDKNDSGTKAGLNLSAIRAVNIAIPSLSEQTKIVCTVDSISNQISAVENKLKSLISLKKSLMQDLLTGKVRVKVS
ncbi:MAG: restriction endonuclease subunit S [Caulobacterales bacterium]|nr:restriction endonuclease subunit S [Caulobacterales bacterium]MCA0372176.1 restriction endonuclease subunit S [Pseudomonadota bacterium]